MVKETKKSNYISIDQAIELSLRKNVNVLEEIELKVKTNVSFIILVFRGANAILKEL